MSGIIPLKVTRTGSQATGFAEFQTGETLDPSVIPVSVATVTFVEEEIAPLAPLASPCFTGNPTAPTPSGVLNPNSIATVEFVELEIAPLAPLASPCFVGNPTAPTPSGVTNPNSIATVQFVDDAVGSQLPAAWRWNDNGDGTISLQTLVGGQWLNAQTFTPPN